MAAALRSRRGWTPGRALCRGGDCCGGADYAPAPWAPWEKCGGLVARGSGEALGPEARSQGRGAVEKGLDSTVRPDGRSGRRRAALQRGRGWVSGLYSRCSCRISPIRAIAARRTGVARDRGPQAPGGASPDCLELCSRALLPRDLITAGKRAEDSHYDTCGDCAARMAVWGRLFPFWGCSTRPRSCHGRQIRRYD